MAESGTSCWYLFSPAWRLRMAFKERSMSARMATPSECAQLSRKFWVKHEQKKYGANAMALTSTLSAPVTKSTYNYMSMQKSRVRFFLSWYKRRPGNACKSESLSNCSTTHNVSTRLFYFLTFFARRAIFSARAAAAASSFFCLSAASFSTSFSISFRSVSL